MNGRRCLCAGKVRFQIASCPPCLKARRSAATNCRCTARSPCRTIRMTSRMLLMLIPFGLRGRLFIFRNYSAVPANCRKEASGINSLRMFGNLVSRCWRTNFLTVTGEILNRAAAPRTSQHRGCDCVPLLVSCSLFMFNRCLICFETLRFVESTFAPLGFDARRKYTKLWCR